MAMDLTLAETVPAPGNNTVSLKPSGTNAVPGMPPGDLSKCYALGEAEGYSVGLVAIDHYGANRFFLYRFLVWKDGGQTTTEVLFNVSNSGSFPDFVKDVPFTVQDGPRQASGTLSIPFHSVDPVPFCKQNHTASASSPLRVYLTGDATYTVSIDCSEGVNLPKLISLSEASQEHPDYWQGVTVKSDYFGPDGRARPVSTKSFDLFEATMTPKPLSAAGARLRRLDDKDSPDDTITFDLTYAMEQGGLEIPMKIKIPIAFFPSGYVIACSLGLGVALGWLATALLLRLAGKPKSWKLAGGALVLGLLLSVFAFAIAFLAYTAKCSLTLFGLEVNPSDELVLFVLGLICGCGALLKARELLNWAGGALPGLSSSIAPAVFFPIAIVLLFCPSARAQAQRVPLVGLSACPGGDVIGLDRDGTVIQFAGSPRGAWRMAGRIDRSLTSSELACGVVDGKATAFVVATAVGNFWAVRMDLAGGVWTKTLVAKGTSVGIAFDADSQLVYLSSPGEREIYRINAGLAAHTGWASIFGSADSIGSLAVDSAGKRLLVGEAFSGVIYSLALSNGRQSTLAEGAGTVNSLGIDRARNLLYVADSARRTIWVAPLAGNGPKKLGTFYHSDDLQAASGVAVDPQSNVWIALDNKPDVVVLGPDGRQLSVIK
jgi:hypothetical protein